MTVPVWMLLGFAAWTVILLVATIGVYRWSRILTGRARITEFRADGADGADWYQRATRAHANCIENLPVFGAIVFALQTSNMDGALVDSLTICILVARVIQSLIHVYFAQSSPAVSARFAFYAVQLASFLVLIGKIAARGAGAD
jgi:uncharacterized MAPEG superfamily protein